MIDVHCHILPEVDDGAESMQQLFIMKGVVITGKKEDWYDQHCDCRR